MNKREKIELAGIFQKLAFNLMEMPEDWEPRKNAEREGYRYIKITVSDVTTGIPAVIRLAAVQGGLASNAIYTFCKDENLDRLINKILEVARWPEDLLEEYNPAIYLGGEVLSDGKHDAKEIAFKRILGGRKTGTRTEETKAKYSKMLDLRWNQWWIGRTDKDFFEAFPKYNYKSLNRARKWHIEGRP